MGFDQGAVHVDPYEPGVTSDPGGSTHVGVGHGVQGLVEADVMVGVDLVLAPVGRVEAFAFEGKEMGLLDVLEDGQGPLAGGAVDPGTCGLETPAQRLALDMLQVQPGLASEEAFPDVGDASLDVRLSRWIPGPGGIDDEAPVPGVVLEGALEDRVVTVGLGDGRLQVVEVLFPTLICARSGPSWLDALRVRATSGT